MMCASPPWWGGELEPGLSQNPGSKLLLLLPRLLLDRLLYRLLLLSSHSIHLLLVIRVIPQSQRTSSRRMSKKRAGAPQNPGSTDYLGKEEVITSSSSQPSLQPASSRPSSWQPCHLPPSISDTDPR